MKMKYLFLVCGMAALFTACQNENEPKVVSDKPGTSGDYRIIIEGEETDTQPSRSSGTIQFVGGTASGAGLYDGTAIAIVSATPDPGYEISYFYGGPDSEPKNMTMPMVELLLLKYKSVVKTIYFMLDSKKKPVRLR